MRDRVLTNTEFNFLIELCGEQAYRNENGTWVSVTEKCQELAKIKTFGDMYDKIDSSTRLVGKIAAEQYIENNRIKLLPL